MFIYIVVENDTLICGHADEPQLVEGYPGCYLASSNYLAVGAFLELIMFEIGMPFLVYHWHMPYSQPFSDRHPNTHKMLSAWYAFGPVSSRSYPNVHSLCFLIVRSQPGTPLLYTLYRDGE